MVDDLTVRDVMTREYVGVSESDTVEDVARLLVEEGEGAAAVLHGQEPVGSVMAGELLGALLESADPGERRIDTIMTQPPQAVRPDESLAQAAAILADARTDHVFVSDGDDLLGVLSENDLITAVTSILTTEPGEPLDDDYDAGMAGTEEPEPMSSQSVCEVCGTLKTDLENINGQLVCDDCRAV